MEHTWVTALVALVLSAAFDAIDHAMLLKVLENMFGITDDAVECFQSYLCP